MPLLYRIFNCIQKKTKKKTVSLRKLSSFIIVPVYRKADCTNPDKYTCINIVSNIAKLYMSKLKNRELDWSKTNDVIKDAIFALLITYTR